ncbi:alpha-amylase family glycosyl hydrolase [Paenibacillus thermoaerophilus]|uniref:Alpha-amylase n=1 Tax=Paenibacillus thermoaerophilus TaxID=1215385 RepID=A0ABW2V3G8_9BACL|nr:alpha-amylase family glycosyl hydrolase [Paenibacillus thermoaerophilus]TMV17668.1 alpha-amylase [Paenibacillus thermoaerophilus]
MRRYRAVRALLIAAAVGTSLTAAGCSLGEDEARQPSPTAPVSSPSPAAGGAGSALPVRTVGPAWEKPKQAEANGSGVMYEIFVRAFADSDGDGIGDLRGVVGKLDYLRELGVEGIWLMPIHPSPSYHGYDVTDYEAVHPDYGTLEDFKLLTKEAHARGMKVIIDLVVNHTSREHPWFRDSAAGGDKRGWYTWAEDAGMEPKGASAAGAASAWHPLGGSHYLGIFWEGMPDLNLDHPEVRAEMIRIGRYWLELGADGFRLDAAKHIYGDFRDTEKSPEVQKRNLDWWKEFADGLRQVRPDVYLVGEVWDSPSVIAPLLAGGLDAGFNFDLSARLLSAARSERDSGLAGWLVRIYELYAKSAGGVASDAPFLTNHDGKRAMSELEGNVDHAKTAASLLLTMPGHPFMYYGEEIGMTGVKPDENLREPMIWVSGDEAAARAAGQTTWREAKFGAALQAGALAQMRDPSSLWSRYRTLLKWRSTYAALRDGGIAEYAPPAADAAASAAEANASVAAFVRYTDAERLLVAHNLSGAEQRLRLAPEYRELAESAAASESAGGGAADTARSRVEGDLLVLAPYDSVIVK